MERRRALLLAQRTLRQLAFAAFGVSLFLPTLSFNSGYLLGFVCAAFAPRYYASNALMLFSPLLMLLMNNTRWGVHAALATLSVISAIFVLTLPVFYNWPRFPDRPGYFVWAGAHCCLAIAFCIPTGAYRRKTRGRAFEVVRMDEASHCPHCGYDIRATPGYCPTCAVPIGTPPRIASAYRLPPRPNGIVTKR